MVGRIRMAVGLKPGTAVTVARAEVLRAPRGRRGRRSLRSRLSRRGFASRSGPSIIRLVGAVLAEQHDEWAEQRRHLGLDALAGARRIGEPTEPKKIPEPDYRALTA